MKTTAPPYKICVLILAFGISFQLHAQSKRVLFLGNSYTYYNNLPQLINNMARTTNDTLISESNTPGGYSLKEHAGQTGNFTSINKIFSRDWDHVVLQEQSQKPSFNLSYVETEVFANAKILCDTIRNNYRCTQPIFYMTWGRENGDASNCNFAPWVCTYEGMDSALHVNYVTMGNDNDALVSPVGAVWHEIRDLYPFIDLYAQDGSHPSPAGSYAAACTFYSIIFGKDPTLVTYDFSLPAAEAALIRSVAKSVAYDSLTKWNVKPHEVQASFNFTIDFVNRLVNFIPYGAQVDSVHWDFGDGHSSTTNFPAHQYEKGGSYNVCLTVWSCGVSDTTCETVLLDNLWGINDPNDTRMISVHPNPVKDQLFIDITDQPGRIEQIEIYDLKGQLVVVPDPVFTNANEPIQVPIQLPPGLYILKLLRSDGYYLGKFVVE